MPLREPKGKSIYFVGIKGTGMSALALLFFKKGAHIQGCDSSQRFPTQEVLEKYAITCNETLEDSSLPDHTHVLIYSSAYEKEGLLVLKQAKSKGIPCFTYAQALGQISQANKGIAVVGTHGKTTTTALAGTLLKAVGAKGTTLVGSAVGDFEGLPVDVSGNDYFLAEVCEYRRNFLNFKAKILLMLNVDWDHVDYFESFEQTKSAFFEMAMSVDKGGLIIYCSDDLGCSKVIERVKKQRKDIKYLPYGFDKKAKEGAWIKDWEIQEGKQLFKVDQWNTVFELPLFGKELVLNAVAALCLLRSLGFSSQETVAKETLKKFRGIRRRQEKLGKYKGALIMDDYAHHPKEIEVVLKGLRQFYPSARLIVDFKFHTLSRTKAFLKEFCQALSLADILIMHEIYGSAREKVDGEEEILALCEELLFTDQLQMRFKPIYYFKTHEETLKFLRAFLRKGDLFLTLGAGDNFHISHELSYLGAQGKH